ncbi:MAG: hypothetical protein ACLTDI_12655 [Acutalibacteraceae bacterium]
MYTGLAVIDSGKSISSAADAVLCSPADAKNVDGHLAVFLTLTVPAGSECRGWRPQGKSGRYYYKLRRIYKKDMAKKDRQRRPK